MIVAVLLLLSCQAFGFSVERGRRSIRKKSPTPDDGTDGRRRNNKSPSSKPRGSSPSPYHQPNKNRQKQSGYELRKRGISTKRTKPPKWEQEGSRLYDEILISGDNLTIEEARELLAQHHQLKMNATRTTSETKARQSSDTTRPDLPFLWGPLSVGPVWKQKLVETTLGYRHPTPIQCQAYPKIVSTKNVTNLLIAAPTGSGKSLAYLLPLLTTQPKQVAILVPTVELCAQIEQVILQLAPQQPTTVLQDNDQDDLSLLENKDKKKKGYFVISTPSSFSKYLRRRQRTKIMSLDVLVLDEADALMENKDTVRIVSRLSNIRMIAASASVGRSLRTKLKEALQAPSLDKAFALITADDRTKKHEMIRKASLLPNTIRHEYHLVCTDNNNEDEIQSTILSMLNEPSSEFQNAIVFVKEEHQAKQLAEQLSEHNPEFQIQTTTTASSKPTLYILPQQLGRGLDLPNVDLVIIVQLPSAAADYLHLSGRTGRNQSSGTVISILTPKQAPILSQIATLLQLQLHPI